MNPRDVDVVCLLLLVATMSVAILILFDVLKRALDRKDKVISTIAGLVIIAATLILLKSMAVLIFR